MSATTIAIAGAAVAGGGGTNVCTYTKSVSATATLGFEEHSDSVVRGEFEYQGTETVTASTCPSAPVVPQFIGGVDLTGSPSSFSGRNVFPAPPGTGLGGERITGEHVYTFQGSINGDTATGVFKYEESSMAVGGSGGTVNQLGVGTFTISFQKQR